MVRQAIPILDLLLPKHHVVRICNARHDEETNQPRFSERRPELAILRPPPPADIVVEIASRKVRAATGETLDFGEGCVYPILHRLEAGRLPEASRKVVNGRSRVVYRATDKGRKKLEESASSWRQIVKAVNLVLQGGLHVEPATA